MVFRLLASLGSALVVFGASVTLAFADGEVERSWVAAESFSFDALLGSTSGDPIDADVFAAKMRAVEKEHERSISTPVAVAERQGSIDAFADLGRSAAAALITDVFAEALDVLTILPSDPLLSSKSPPEFIRGSDTSVRIDPPGSEDSQLVVSSLPLRNDDDQIVSGRLVANQDGFGPKAPLANVGLPGDADGPVVLPDVDVEFSFAGAAGSSGQLIDAGDAPGEEMVLYPNTHTDTDTAVTYTLQGVETFNFLRSAESPERLSLDYELPSGANLEASADGGAIVLDSEGKSLVAVFPPFAVDAQGTDVPMTLSVEGSSIGLNVPHRGKDFAYPIMVDPVQHVRNWWTNGSSDNFHGWSFHQEGTGNYAGSLGCPSALASVDPCGGTGAGVYVSAVPGKHYPANSKGYWRWTVPGGPSSSIVSAVLDSWRYRKGNSNAGWAFYNLHHTNGTSTGHNITAGGGGSNLWMYGGNSGYKYLHSGLMTNTANTIPSGASNYRYNRIAAYTANLTDIGAPSLTLGAAPAGWLGPNTPFSVSASAQDNGLGMYAIQAKVGSSWPNKWFGWCLGTYPLPCPTTSVNVSMPFNSNDFPTGINSVPVKASDVLMGTGHETIKNFTVKVDRTDPAATLSGSMLSTANTWISKADNGLTVHATDSRSGVVQIDVLLNDEEVATKSEPCSQGACSMTLNTTLDLEGAPDGVNTLEVVITDHAGNTSSELRTFDLDIAPPTSTINGTPPNEGSEGRPYYDLNIDALDDDAATVQSGVAEIDVRVDGLSASNAATPCSTGGCGLSHGYRLDPDDYSNGRHDLEIVIADEAGNTAVHSQTFDSGPDNTDPVVEINSADLDLVDANRPRQFSIPVNAADFGSGVAELEVRIDGLLVNSKSAPCVLGGCNMHETFTVDGSALTTGTHVLEVTAEDGSANTHSDQVEFEIDTLAPGVSISGSYESIWGGWTNQNSKTLVTNIYGYTSSNVVVDVKIDGVSVGTASIPCGGTLPCNPSLNIPVDLSAISNGPHETTVTVTNGSHANTTSGEFKLARTGSISAPDATSIHDSLYQHDATHTPGPYFTQNGSAFDLTDGAVTMTGDSVATGALEFDIDGQTLTVNTPVSGSSSSSLSADGTRYSLSNVAIDTDRVVKAEALGLGVIVRDQIRSSSAPRSLIDDVDASFDYELRLSDDGHTIEILDTDQDATGVPVALVSILNVVDANGNTVDFALSDTHSGDVDLDIDSAGSPAYPIRIERRWGLTAPDPSLSMPMSRAAPNHQCAVNATLPTNILRLAISGKAKHKCKVASGRDNPSYMETMACLQVFTNKGFRNRDCDYKRNFGPGTREIRAEKSCSRGSMKIWRVRAWGGMMRLSGAYFGAVDFSQERAVRCVN